MQLFFKGKKQMTAKFIKNSQKIPGGKTANFGSQNSNLRRRTINRVN